MLRKWNNKIDKMGKILLILQKKLILDANAHQKIKEKFKLGFA